MSLKASEIDAIRKTVSQSQITAVIYQLARGLDRRDKALLLSCFHPGATDDHGMFVGGAEEFCDWVMEQLGNYERTQHYIANINIEFADEKAVTESYFLAHHVMETADGSKKDVIAAGRYLDTFERRDDSWKIVHRKALYDWSRVDDYKSGWETPPVSDILERGIQGPEDASYAIFAALKG